MIYLRKTFWNLLGRYLFACTPHNAYQYRTALLKLAGMKCGARVRSRRNVYFDFPWNVIADDLVIFGDFAIINASKTISIGKRCVISQYAMLITQMGNTQDAGKSNVEGSITIENDCWVASDSVVLPNAHIETGVVVGARSLVEGRLSSWSICMGEPAVKRTQRVLYGTS